MASRIESAALAGMLEVGNGGGGVCVCVCSLVCLDSVDLTHQMET